MRRLELYPFKHRDERTGKWIRARYKAEVPVIQRRYSDWETHRRPRNSARHADQRGRVQPVQAVIAAREASGLSERLGFAI
jgi:hypothetical protein